jgi:cell division initiation protein
MKVTPLDLRQTQFKTAVRGFDKIEVTMLLSDAADDYEAALREIDRLRQDVTRMESALSEHRDREANLRNTLLTAQKVADQLREDAEQQARLVVREAESRAEVIVQKAHGRAEELDGEIAGLYQRRRDAEQALVNCMNVLQRAIEDVRTEASADEVKAQAADETVRTTAAQLGPRPVPSQAPPPLVTPEPVTLSVSEPPAEPRTSIFLPAGSPPESEEEEMLAQLRQLALKHEQRAALRDR